MPDKASRPDPGCTVAIAPNFKRRLSGVTSTIVQLVPRQASRLGIATMGPDVLPARVPRLPYGALLRFWRRPLGRPVRIWHARRNTEMLAGIVLRDALRMPMRLVFTSAAQRHHTDWTRRLLSRMDAIIATSARSAGYLTQPATVILHGVATDHFRPDAPMPTGDFARALDGRRIVGCSGRIRHQKGTDLFVDAMLAVLPGRPDWTAVVTGRATREHAAFKADLEARIKTAGLSERILFVGEVDDVAPWFRRFDLYVAPPRNEGFGLTPLEAMASATPVVASDAGAFREQIVEGVTGRVVPAGDAGALAAAIEPYMDDDRLRETAAKAALAHVRDRFDLTREIDAIEAVYESVWAAASERVAAR